MAKALLDKRVNTLKFIFMYFISFIRNRNESHKWFIRRRVAGCNRRYVVPRCHMTDDPWRQQMDEEEQQQLIETGAWYEDQRKHREDRAGNVGRANGYQLCPEGCDQSPF